jgi:branched-subunit amino acid transport protein AzlD
MPSPTCAAGRPVRQAAVTAGLHLWRHNAVLSILGGTAVRIALASV